MSTHITSGTLGQAMAPLVFAPFVQQFGLRATPLLMIPGAGRAAAGPAAPHPDVRTAAGASRNRWPQSAAAVRAAADAALPDRGAADTDRHELRDLRARPADQTRPLARAGRHGRVDLSDRRRPRRIHRRTLSRSLRCPPRHHPVSRLLSAVPDDCATAPRVAVRRRARRSAGSCSSPRCRST